MRDIKKAQAPCCKDAVRERNSKGADVGKNLGESGVSGLSQSSPR